MSDQTSSDPSPRSLPDNPNLDWLRKQARRRLDDLRQSRADARLADAQFALAKEYGFPSWRALKAHIDGVTLDGQLFDAARTGDIARITALLDAHPEALAARSQPYAWTLLHTAAYGRAAAGEPATSGHLAIVDLLLNRGLDVNVREKGDDSYALHWAAAAGHLAIVRRLVEAGADVIGHGDDHQLEVIGWATCWDPAPQVAVAEFLIAHGARHHIFSAIAMNLADDVRRIAAADPAQLHRRLSRNEDFRQPLHFAVQKNRPEMVSLLVELGADPLGGDGHGCPPAAYARTAAVDGRLLEAIRARGTSLDLFTALALNDEAAAADILRATPDVAAPGGANFGVLHLMAKRGNARAVQWLLARGVDPNARWTHWDAEVTPLHMAIMENHPDVVRLLLAARADPLIKDSKHDADAIGWADFFGRAAMLDPLRAAARDVR